MKLILKLQALPLLLFCFFVSAQVKTDFNNKAVINEQGRFTKPYKIHVDFEIPAKSISDLLGDKNNASRN